MERLLDAGKFEAAARVADELPYSATALKRPAEDEHAAEAAAACWIALSAATQAQEVQSKSAFAARYVGK